MEKIMFQYTSCNNNNQMRPPRKLVIKQKLFLFFPLIFSILCASCGESPERKSGWSKINNGGDLDLFVDFSTLKVNGEARSIWELRSYRNGKYSNVANITYFSAVQEVTYFCSSMSFSAGDLTWYSAENGKGNIIKVIPIPPAKTRIPDGSELVNLYNYVCSL